MKQLTLYLAVAVTSFLMGALVLLTVSRVTTLTPIAPTAPRGGKAVSAACTDTVTLVFPTPTPTPIPTPSPLPTPIPSESPKPSCRPRPACLDTKPFCYMPEPIEGWCPSPAPSGKP